MRIGVVLLAQNFFGREVSRFVLEDDSMCIQGSNGGITLKEDLKEINLRDVDNGSAHEPKGVIVRGEVQRIRETPYGMYFELLDKESGTGRAYSLSVFVSPKDLNNIRGYWKRTRSKDPEIFRERHELELTGDLIVESQWVFKLLAKKVIADLGTGPLSRDEDYWLSELKGRGVDSWRLLAVNQYMEERRRRRWKTPEKLKKVLVIASDGSNGRNDIETRLRGIPAASLSVEYQSLSWETGKVHDALLDAKARDFDLVLIAAGGGPRAWSERYQMSGPAFEIFSSPVPVITAIGHAGNVTVADRMADHAFDTPGLAAAAIQSASFRERRAIEADAAQEARQKTELDLERCVAGFQGAEDRNAKLQSKLVKSTSRSLSARLKGTIQMVFLLTLGLGMTLAVGGISTLFPDGNIRHSIASWVFTLGGIGICLIAAWWRNRRIEQLENYGPILPPSGEQNIDSWVDELEAIDSLRSLRKSALIR